MNQSNFNLKIYITLNFLCSYAYIFTGFGAFSANQTANKTAEKQASYYMTPATQAQSTTQQCPPCTNSDNSSSTYIPGFLVQICDINGNVLNTSSGNGHTFSTPTSFTYENAIFSVHLFPPSNSISGSSITYASGTKEGTYVIVYTIKDPAGATIHKEIDNISLTQIPHRIDIVPLPTTTPPSNSDDSTPQAATFSTQTATPTKTVAASSTFIPSLGNSLSTIQKQQILNGISPITQKFLFNQSSSSISVTPISGTFDADDSQGGSTLTFSGVYSANAKATTGSTIGSIGIILYGPNGGDTSTPLVIFSEQSQVLFNETDLTQGILLNISIFPSESGSNFPVVATMRSVDGFKMRKKCAINFDQNSNTTVLSSLPTTISIQHTVAGSSTANTVLTSSFLNGSASATAFNIISPLNLRFIITRPAGHKNLMILMV